MLHRTLQIAVVAMMASLLSGCPKPYLAFEKHGGSFLVKVTGEQFVHISNTEWNPSKNALVYFYRPDSRWGADEIDVPSVYIDDHHYFGMRSNGFTWLEMAPGTRHIAVRRPIGLLLGFEGLGEFALDKTVDAEFEVEAGKIYYFRYFELGEPSEANPEIDPDHPLAQGDMQLVSRSVAIKEIVETRYIENEPPFAKNSAGASIVEVNLEDDYDKEVERLEAEKEAEMVALKEQGYWRDASWYWPFGGGPTKRLKSDIELQKLDKAREDYLDEQERIAEEEAARNKSKWWPF